MERAADARESRRRAGRVLNGGLDPRFPALVTLRVEDLARSLAFWHERLGLPVKLRSGNLAELQSETVLVVLLQDASAEGAPARGMRLGWEVEDLAAAEASLAERGIVAEPVDVPEGVDPAAFGRRICFQDPDGHVLELAGWS